MVWNNVTGTAVKDVAAATAGQVWAGNDNGSPVTSLSLALSSAELPLTDASTTNWNMANGYNAIWTLTGNHMLAAPTNPIVGRTYILRVAQDSTGGRIPTLPGSTIFNFMGAGAPTFSTGANLFDVISLYCYNASTPAFIATFIKGS